MRKKYVVEATLTDQAGMARGPDHKPVISARTTISRVSAALPVQINGGWEKYHQPHGDQQRSI